MEFKCKQCGKCCSQFDSDSGGIMIFEWEKAALEEIAKKEGVDFEIEPGQTDYDEKSNTRIITTFAFKARACPFLKDKRCSIHPSRPIYCKAYPLLVEMDDEKFDLKLLACPHAEIPKLGLKEYYKSFGEIFLYALELEIFRHHYLEIVEALEDNGLVKLRDERPGDNPKVRTLFEFLVEQGFISESDKNELIKDILNLSNARAMVGLK